MTPLLSVRNLSLSFPGNGGKALPVLHDLDLQVRPGEILAVAGSSGSGKSLLASAILGILPKNARLEGEMIYDGSPLTPERQKILRGSEIALVPQSVSFLDPLMKVGRQVDKNSRSKEKRRSLFKKLQLPEKTGNLDPFQLSGGMARRVLVSTAMLSGCRLVIADEPTPGMSLVQARAALSLFRQMADEGAAVILITHDIDLAFDFADRISIFYAGTTVETQPAENFRRGPEYLCHPYSRALWNALPQNGVTPIPGSQHYAGTVTRGCVFAPRCPMAGEKCHVQIPPSVKAGEGEVRCFYGTERP